MDKLKNDVPYLSISKNDHAKQYMSRINISTESFLSNELITYILTRIDLVIISYNFCKFIYNIFVYRRFARRSRKVNNIHKFLQIEDFANIV